MVVFQFLFNGSSNRNRWPSPWVVAAVFAMVAVSERSASAYIDPGSGSLIYQALLAGLLGLSFTFRRAYGSIARFVRGRFGAPDAASEKANPDHV